MILIEVVVLGEVGSDLFEVDLDVEGARGLDEEE
ncbi:MAG: hypothetical protein RL326_1485 [Pseudomonadota bacterium]